MTSQLTRAIIPYIVTNLDHYIANVIVMFFYLPSFDVLVGVLLKCLFNYKVM